MMNNSILYAKRNIKIKCLKNTPTPSVCQLILQIPPEIIIIKIYMSAHRK